MSRTKGARNVKPSKAAVTNYLRLLSEKADQGDVHAAGWLCQLDLIGLRDARDGKDRAFDQGPNA